MRWFAFLVLLVPRLALAAVAAPTITAPTGAIVLPAGTTVGGISVTAAGAIATTTYNVTLSCVGCTLTASGTNVSGSGTKSVSIGPDTATQLSAALGTLKVAWPTAVLSASDTLTIGASTSGGSAAPAKLVISVDGRKYLTFGTTAAAQARSQAQCTALGCKGATKCWWAVQPLSGTTISGDACAGTASPDAGAAVQIRPGDASYDVTTTAAAPHPGTGLISTEQSNLKTATAAGLPTPQ